MRFFYITILITLTIINCNKNQTDSNYKKLENPKKIIQVNTSEETLGNLKTLKLPVTDSTNFDNYRQLNRISDKEILKLGLRNLDSNAEEFFSNYKVSISDSFKSIVITTKTEFEMKTFLVNINSDSQIIDKLQISYDEIAESAFTSVGKITKNKIVIENYNFMSEVPDKNIEVYYIDKSGKFIKN